MAKSSFRLGRESWLAVGNWIESEACARLKSSCVVCLSVAIAFAFVVHPQAKEVATITTTAAVKSSLSALCVVFTSCAQVTFLIAPLRLH